LIFFLSALTGIRTGESSVASVAIPLLIAIGCIALLPQLFKMHSATRAQEKVHAIEERNASMKRTAFLAALAAGTDHKPLECTFLGGSGLEIAPKAAVLLTCSAGQIVLTNPTTLRQNVFSFEGLSAVEVTGPGTQTTNAGVAGGGFGLEGFLKGVLAASAINALTTKSSTNTFLRLLGSTAEAYLHTTQIEPAALRILLSPAIVQMEANKQRKAAPTRLPLSEEIAKLHKLAQEGVLTAEEFVVAKRRLLESYLPVGSSES